MSGYDGGDCCECTCVSTDDFTCGDSSDGGYTCVDPGALCFVDGDATTNPEPEPTSPETAYATSPSFMGDNVADGICDAGSNNEECGGSRLENVSVKSCLPKRMDRGGLGICPWRC